MTELPDGWVTATINELSVGQGITDGPFGSNLKTAHYTPEGPRVIRLQNIGDGRFKDEHAHIALEHFELLRKHAVEPADVLVASLGEQLPRACLAPPNLGLAIVKADCIRIRTSVAASSDYLMWALNAPQTRDRVAESIKGVGRPRVNLGDLRSLEIPVAPRAEQERIVAAIEEAVSKLDAGEAGLRTVRQLLKRMREAVLAAAVTGRLVPQDPADSPATKLLTDLGIEPSEAGQHAGLPLGWCWASLGDLAKEVRNGMFFSRPNEHPPGIPILRIGSVRPMTLDVSDVRFADVEIGDANVRRATVAEGDLLFTRYNGNPAFVGACAVVPATSAPLLHPDKLIRVRLLPGSVSASFVAIAVSTGASRRFIDLASKTTAGQAGIAGSDLKRVPIPVPPASEQERIVAEVERQLSFIEVCERAVDVGLDRSNALRRSVLKVAFEGRLVAQDRSDEPASVLLERISADRALSGESGGRRRRNKVEAS